MMTPSERRAEPRIVPIVSVEASVAHRRAELRNISMSGIAVEIDRGFSLRSRVDVILLVADDSLTLKARVVRCRVAPKTGGTGSGSLVYVAGLEFCDLDRVRRDLLEQFLLELSLAGFRSSHPSGSGGGAHSGSGAVN